MWSWHSCSYRNWHQAALPTVREKPQAEVYDVYSGLHVQCTPETCLEQCYEGPVVWYLSSHHNHTLLYYGTHCYYTCDNSVTSKWQFIHSLTCCSWTSITNNFLWINHFDTGEFHFNRFGCWAHGVSMWMCVCNSSTMSV